MLELTGVGPLIQIRQSPRSFKGNAIAVICLKLIYILYIPHYNEIVLELYINLISFKNIHCFLLMRVERDNTLVTGDKQFRVRL